MGVIDKNTGELRSTYDILQDLSKAWGHLTSVEKQELAETVAGKTQRSLFTALMQNFSSAVGATEAALNSEGSAAAENAKRMDSLNGKVQQLQSAWQSFSRNTIDSSFIKNILSSLTELIKFIDKIGGLPTVLATATSALLLFKGGLILDKTFKAFSSGLSLIQNGISTVVYAIPNAISGFKAFSAGIVSAGTAIEAAAPLLSLIAIAITGVVAGIKAFTKAQKEATSAAIESSQSAEQSITKNKEKQKTLEKEVETLKKERDAYINNADASKNLNNDSVLESKNEEIAKRETNIERIKEENEEYLKQREAAARSMKTGKAVQTGVSSPGLDTLSHIDDMSKYGSILKDINKQLADASDNSGAYQKKLQDLRAEYEKQAQAKEKNNQSSAGEVHIINQLTKGINANQKAYEEDKKTADEFYDILKSGGNISDKNIEWLQKFYDLNDDQINQLKEGKDVRNEDSDATNQQTEAQDALNQKIQEANDAADNWNSKLQSNIDQMKNYGDNMDILNTAQQELSNSGSITAETFEKITQNNLLPYLDNVNGSLQVNTNAFINSTEQIKANALANLEASTYEQIRGVILEDLGKKEDAAGTAAANASSKLSAAGTEAQQMGAKMLAASGDVATLTAQLNQLNKAEGGSGEVSTDVTAKVQNILSQASKTKAFIESWKPSTSKSAVKSSGGSKSRGSKKSSSSKKSTSSKDTYKATIDTLYNYKNALDNAKESVDKLQDALKNTDNLNEQEKYMRQLIDALNDEINKTNELKAAQTRQINDYINQLRAQGFAIDYNSSKNELYINNMQHLADFSGDTAKHLEKLINKTQDLNSDNRKLDGSVRDLKADIKDYYDQIADIPEKKLKKFNELMKDFQQNRLDQIQNQIDDIQHEMDNDPRLKQLENQIEALENQNDELDKQKELEEKLLAVEEAKEKLENQRKQKTLQVYRERGRVKCEPL